MYPNNVNDNGRIGDQVKMHSLNVRGHILSSFSIYILFTM